MTAYKIKSSLMFESHYGDIDFKGCEAQIVNETESYYFIQFYCGLPFMISKSDFLKASVEIDKPTSLTGMEIHDVTLWLGEKQIKRFRTLLSPDDPNYVQVKKNSLTWFKLSDGVHYDRITTEFINEVKSNTTMAKKVNPDKIEEAEVIEEIPTQSNALTVAQKIAETLPAIPDSFEIDGQVYSVAVVAEMEKEADELLTKATPETYNSKTIWDEVSALKNKLVKMRTTPDNKRKELSKPYQDFVKAIKEKTDAVGNAAKAVQDKLDAAIQAKEDHEAELLRQAEEKKRIRTEERRESLRSLGGAYDINAGTISFSYLPGTIVNQMQLMEYDDAEWGNQFDIIRKAYDAEQLRLATEKEREEKEKAEALKAVEEASERIVNYRLKELKLEGFEFNESLQAWSKNGVVIHMQAVRGYTDEQWDESIRESNQEKVVQPNMPPVQPSSPVQGAVPPVEAKEEPVAPVFDPLAAVIGGMAQKQEERVEELDGTIRKELVFTRDQPFIDVFFKNSTLRVAPIEYSDEAIHGVLIDKIAGNVNNDDLGLKFIAIKK